MPYSDYRPDLMGSATLDAVGQLRGGLAAELHAGLHGGRLRRRRHRLDQDRLPLRHRFRARAVHRSEGAGLHHGRGLQRRHAGGQVGVQAQHPPLEPLALHRRGQGLPGARRHHHHPLRRPPLRLARHPPADLLRERVRVPRVRRPDRHLRLRRAAREPEDRHRAGAGRALARRAADAGAGGRAVPPRDQGRRQVGQSIQPSSIARCGSRPTARSRGLPATARFAPGSFAAHGRGAADRRAGRAHRARARRQRARSCAGPIRCALCRATPRSCTSGATRTASPTRRSAPTRRANISSSAATRPSSTSWAIRATTSRSPARSGASSTR